MKGWKAIGNKLIDKKIISIQTEQSVAEEESVDNDEPVADEMPVKGVQADLFGAPAKGKSKPIPPSKNCCKSEAGCQGWKARRRGR